MSIIGNHTERANATAVFLGVLMLAICLSPSMGYAAEEGKSKVQPEKSPDDVICKRQKISGSHMKQRICFTRAEWDEIRRQSQANAASAMRGGGTISPQ